MEEAPLPFLEFSTNIKSNNKDFQITLSQKLNNLLIKITQLNSNNSLNFESEFTKSQLDKISKFFRMFDDIRDLIPEISDKFKNNEFSFIENQSYIQLKIEYKIKNLQNFSLFINNKENFTSVNDDSLYDLINHVIKENEYLKKEISKLKNEIKEIKNKLYVVKTLEESNNIIDSKILTKIEDIKLISNWIKPNKKLKFNLLYRSSRDGDRVSTFASKVSGKSPTLIIIKSKCGYKFGGYTSEQWNMSGSYTYKSDPSSFIFSIDKKKV